MKSRLAQLLIAELLAFGALVFGGLAALGGAVTWSGGSQHPESLSWLLVTLFATTALLLGTTAVLRIRRAILQPS